MGGDSPESAFPAHTIVDTAASITAAVVAAAATPGGSNLAWRSDLNDRPRFVFVAVYETGHPMPCYYKRLGYFHIARLDVV
ncbi:hypothetical protein ALC62_00364 [Cyphomyrmex costatus]|uniref:Uncharacterized protein n=1 Tax=Cyphomyrmex costatus TaxID=456900 RepID=A0A195D757_9HYME|nr:hypothetical protein ALC62_00364 [Cyphomyrmex costatus]